MKSLCWVAGCAALLLVGLWTPVRAQTASDLTGGWDVRAGFFIPERSAARSKEGDLWLTVGADRTIYQMDRIRGSLSIDYYGSGSLYNVPIRANARWEGAKLRLGLSGGVGMSHDLEQGILGFSYALSVGYDLIQGPNPVFADVRYEGMSTGHGNLNGWAFTLGYHF